MIIKVCGMREAQNIRQLDLVNEVDWIGFIFTDQSKRNAFDIEDFDPQTIKKRVGVFVDANHTDLQDTIDRFQLEIVQLHGFESPEYCKILLKKNPELEIMKAFSVDDSFDFDQTIAYENVVSYFLFDAKGAAAGGNGISFNWEVLKQYKGKIPFLLAGGINVDSGQLIKEFSHPKWIGIDINSGFEERAGYKNIAMIKEFTKQLKKTIQVI